MRKLKLALFAATAICSTPTLAQVATAPAETPGDQAHTAAAPLGSSPAEDSSHSGGDIVVTAQKRGQRLQDVPLTIQAFSEDTIQKRGIDDIGKLTNVAPSVQISTFSNQKPILYIRGIGTRTLGPGADQSVGIFIDDFYAGDSSALFSGLADIERIEVLKGPQGTLYGRNTIAGAISIVTKAPSPTTEGRIEGSVGNFGLVSLKGSVSGPIAGDDVLGRLSFYSTKRDGYMRNLFAGASDGMGIDQSGLRGKILVHLTPDFSATVSADYNRDTSPGQLGKNSGPGIFLKRSDIPAPAQDPRAFFTKANTSPTTDAKNYGANLRLDWKSPDINILSLTQYRKGNFHNIQELEATELDILKQDGRQRSHNFSQEFRILSDPGGALSFDGKLDWIAGLFYYHSNATAGDILTLGRDSVAYQLSGHNTVGFAGATVKSTSYAAYLDATFHITPTLSLTGGLRYSRDRKDGTQTASTDSPGLPLVSTPFSVPVRLRDSSVDPKVSINWKPSDNILAYATYSSGYKSGGFQYLALIPQVGSSVYGPETVKYYETGLKTQWFDRKLTFNIAGFYGNYSGLQLSRTIPLFSPSGALVGSSNITDNAGSVRLKGIETETRLSVTDHFQLNANVTYLDNRFKRYNQCGVVISAGCAILDGTRLPRSPKIEINAGAEYTLPVGGSDELTFRADWTHRSKMALEAGAYGAYLPLTNSSVSTLNALYREPARDIVDLRATYTHGAWELSAWMTNVTNEVYTTGFVAFPGEFINYYAPPRMYGTTLRFTF